MNPTPDSQEVEAAGGEQAAEQTGETAQLLVTEVTDGSCFYCQRVSEEHQKVRLVVVVAVAVLLIDPLLFVQKLDALMSELQKVNAGGAVASAKKWAKGDLACVRYAEDGLWYRVRLMEGPSERRFKIHYLDFGNNEVRLETDFRPLPASLAAVPPQVRGVSQELVCFLKKML